MYTFFIFYIQIVDSLIESEVPDSESSTMKMCTRCKVEKPAKDFLVRSLSKDGLSAACGECIRAYKRARYAGDPVERYSTMARVKSNEALRKERDPIYRVAWNAWHKAKERHRVPKWVKFTRDILPVYRQLLAGVELAASTREGWVVDHIIPLGGKTVSGLHVPNNLQAMLFTDNSSKGCEFNEALLALYDL